MDSCCSTSSKTGFINAENHSDVLAACIAPGCSYCLCCLSESQRPASSKDGELQQDLDDLTVLKSLADGQKSKEAAEEVLLKKEEQYVPDESDSTKSRRLAEDYDSTKNGMDYGKYPGTHTPLFVKVRWFSWSAPRWVWVFLPIWTPKGRRHATCFRLSLARHFEKEWTEETRACGGDKQRQIERVKDRTRAGKRERLSSRLSSETAVVKAEICTALHWRLSYTVWVSNFSHRHRPIISSLCLIWYWRKKKDSLLMWEKKHWIIHLSPFPLIRNGPSIRFQSVFTATPINLLNPTDFSYPQISSDQHPFLHIRM